MSCLRAPVNSATLATAASAHAPAASAVGPRRSSRQRPTRRPRRPWQMGWRLLRHLLYKRLRPRRPSSWLQRTPRPSSQQRATAGALLAVKMTPRSCARALNAQRAHSAASATLGELRRATSPRRIIRDTADTEARPRGREISLPVSDPLAGGVKIADAYATTGDRGPCKRLNGQCNQTNHMDPRAHGTRTATPLTTVHSRHSAVLY